MPSGVNRCSAAYSSMKRFVAERMMPDINWLPPLL
jgi:hypothetical protein